MLNDPKNGLQMIIPFAAGEGDVTFWFSKESNTIGLRVRIPTLDDPLTIELPGKVVHCFLLNYPDEKMTIIQEMMSVTTNLPMDGTTIIIVRFPQKPHVIYLRIPAEVNRHNSMNIPVDEVLLLATFKALQQQLLMSHELSKGGLAI